MIRTSMMFLWIALVEGSQALALGRDGTSITDLFTTNQCPRQTSAFSSISPSKRQLQDRRKIVIVKNALRQFANYDDEWDDSYMGWNNYYDSPRDVYSSAYPYPGPRLSREETSPYYDAAWSQSIVRRDNPIRDYYSPHPSSYPGLRSSRSSPRYYNNPTNPYYDPIWSQSIIRNDEPIRDYSHSNRYYREYYPY